MKIACHERGESKNPDLLTCLATALSTAIPNAVWITVLSLSGAATAFEPRFEFGKYKGQLVDVRARRSVDIVSVATGTVIVQHFFHQGRFWEAEIPLDGVAEVLGQQFNFSASGNIPLNHVQARFRMRPGFSLKLTAMDASRQTTTVDDFVSSVEAVGPKDVVWNFSDAVFGHLVNAHRFVSTEQVVLDRIVTEGYVLPQAQIRLSESERKASLARLLNDADQAAMSQPYYLFRIGNRSSNCTSTKFAALDASIRYDSAIQRMLASFLGDLPLSPRLYLMLRGRLGEARPSLNEEFSSRILAAEFGVEARQAYLRNFDENGNKRSKACSDAVRESR